jgi:hypothetical protein
LEIVLDIDLASGGFLSCFDKNEVLVLLLLVVVFRFDEHGSRSTSFVALSPVALLAGTGFYLLS